MIGFPLWKVVTQGGNGSSLSTPSCLRHFLSLTNNGKTDFHNGHKCVRQYQFTLCDLFNTPHF